MPQTPQPPHVPQPSSGSRTPGEAAEVPQEAVSAAPAQDAEAAEPAGDGASGAAEDAGADAGDAAAPDGDAADEGAADGADPAEQEDPVAAAVLAAAGRATLPFQAARMDRSFATAFWYNDLVESTPGREVIRQYLVTAQARTRYELGQFTLREGLAEPELPADELVMPSFAKKWTALGDLGVAVMPTVDLHLHAEKGGWRWTTDEVTAGLAAQPEDVALIGAEPLPAYVLGHEVEDAGSRHCERPQRLLPGAVVRTSDDPAAPVRFTAALPDGFAGAPVFLVLPMEDGRLKLVCLGPVLPGPEGEDGTPGAVVVTFDLLRPAVHAVTPRRNRRWWQRG